MVTAAQKAKAAKAEQDEAVVPVIDGQETIDDTVDDLVKEGLVEVVEDLSGLTENQIKNKLRSQAERIVVDNHRDEFNAEADKLYKKHGLVFRRKLTATERAAKLIEDTLKEHPELRPVFPGVGMAAKEHGAPEGTVVG